MALTRGPVIPVLVIDRVDEAVPLARALLAGGVLLASRAPLNTADAWPGWLMLASGLYLLVRRQRFPD